MPSNPAMLASQRVVQVCLFLVAAIAMIGGSLQMYLGEPRTLPRLDNVHRFMAGIYLSTGLINLWAALTIRRQGTLVYLLAIGVLLAGIGRLVSISHVGLPEPASVWLGCLIPELLLPVVITVAHIATGRRASPGAPVPQMSFNDFSHSSRGCFAGGRRVLRRSSVNAIARLPRPATSSGRREGRRRALRAWTRVSVRSRPSR